SPLVPRGGVRFRLLHPRARGHQPARGLVGVVVLAAVAADRGAADAALAGAVDAGKDVDAVRLDYLRRLRAGLTVLVAILVATEALPSSAPDARNAASTPFFALGDCMRSSNASNSASSSPRLCERAFTSAWNSSHETSTAFGASWRVIATAPRAACSRTAPNSFLRRVAATLGTSTSSPRRLRKVRLLIVGLLFGHYTYFGYF